MDSLIEKLTSMNIDIDKKTITKMVNKIKMMIKIMNKKPHCKKAKFKIIKNNLVY